MGKQMPYTYDFERPNLTVDLIILRHSSKPHQDEILLIKRKKDPFKGKWAFPGGFVNPNEPTVQAASRELEEETGVRCLPEDLGFIGVYDTPGADPRGWRITVVYDLIVPMNTKAVGQDDAEEAKWFQINKLDPKILAFDHARILTDYVFGENQDWKTK